MKKFAAALAFIKKLPKRTKLIALGAIIALLIPAVVLALKPDHKQTEQAPVTSSTEPETQPAEQTVAAAVAETPSPEPASPADTPSPTTTTQPAKATPKPSTSQQSQPTKPVSNNSGELPPATVNPLPMFNVAINAYAAVSQSPNQMYVPFTIIRAPGHTSSMNFGVGIMSAPAADHGASCDVSMKEANLGYLLIFVPDTAPTGIYTCRLNVNDGRYTRTANFMFEVTDTTVETP